MMTQMHKTFLEKTKKMLPLSQFYYHLMNNSLLEQIAQQRILILDGAMGTMIQRYGLT